MADDYKGSKENQNILETAHKRFNACEEFYSEIRRDALADLEFISGEQWPTDVKNARAQDQRPCLTINKMPQFVRNVTNDQKQNRPAVKVSPVDDGADVQTAKVLQGLIRNIENTSDAEYSYDKAFEGAVRGGFGFFRVLTDYVSDKSFDQEIKIEMIANPFKAYIDPDSVKPDGSDSRYGFQWEDLPREDFIAEFGESKLKNHSDWQAANENYSNWFEKDHVRICEYFYQERKRTKLYLLSDGKSYFKDEIIESDQKDWVFVEGMNDQLGEPVPIQVQDVRDTTRLTVYWVKMNAVEVLEKTVWPDKFIPIIPVYGDVLNIDDKVKNESLVRHAKDPQKILNYWASTEAEAITLAPKAPFIGVEGQFEGRENAWKNANIKNFPYLEYKAVELNGNLVPAPMRNAFEPPVMAITNARTLANQDIKETTGIYQSTLGQQGSETSGIAIQRRNQQSQTSNFHFFDNLSKSIRHCGRIMVNVIPKIYDAERTIRTIAPDGQEEMVAIHSTVLMEGQKRPYDFSHGKYDVSVSTGPSYETKRQESRDSMLSMSQSSPKFAEVASDLMVKNMDWPGADEIAERLRKTIPPDILGEEGMEDIPPQVQAQMAQMKQTVEMMSQELEQAKEIISKDVLALESKERIETMKVQSDLKIELVKIQGKNQSIVLEKELAETEKRLDLLGYDRPIGNEMETAEVESEVTPGSPGEPGQQLF